MVKKRQIYLFLIQIVFSVVCDAARKQSRQRSARLQDLNYVEYPRRKNNEAAVVEWGNSAVISALEAAVAGFGPQTSRGAYFEVCVKVDKCYLIKTFSYCIHSFQFK